MNTRNNGSILIYGNDSYLSYGLGVALYFELDKIKNNEPEYEESTISIWVLNDLSLVNVIAFTEKKNNLPGIILCNAKYIRMLSRLPLFMDVALIDAKSSIEKIKKVFLWRLKSQAHTQQQMAISSILYTSLKQKDVAMLLLKGYSPINCANVLQVSVKTISHHKRSLMKNLDLRSDQEFITVLKINERFYENKH